MLCWFFDRSLFSVVLPVAHFVVRRLFGAVVVAYVLVGHRFSGGVRACLIPASHSRDSGGVTAAPLVARQRFGVGGHADFVLDMSGVGAMLTGMHS